MPRTSAPAVDDGLTIPPPPPRRLADLVDAVRQALAAGCRLELEERRA